MNYKRNTVIKEILCTLLDEDLPLATLLEIKDAVTASLWSSETHKILRAASGLLREVYHRDRYLWETPTRRPWECLIPYRSEACESN